MRRGGADQRLAPSAESARVDVNLDPPSPHSDVFSAARMLADEGLIDQFRPRVVFCPSLVVVSYSGGVWTLHRRDDGRIVAGLAVTGGDFPWLTARVDPGEGLDEVLPLFAEELLRLDRIDDDTESWERAYDAIRAVVTLRYPEGHEVPEFMLHIDGDEAWWRWSDEPFDHDP